MDNFGLYVILTRPAIGHVAAAEIAVRCGVRMLQLREKDMSDGELLRTARELRAVTRGTQTRLIINDRPDIALLSEADGVHVGQDDMAAAEARRLLGPDKIVGVSVHTPEEAEQALRDGADYLGVGAVFSTSTKTDVSVLTHEALRAICGATPLPAVAIGGISLANVQELAGSGVEGIAVVSAIFGAPEIREAAQALLAASEKMVG